MHTNPDGSKTYTLEDLEKMPRARAAMLLSKAVKITGTAVVRDKDGRVKYDDPALAGTYNEEALDVRK